MAKVNTGISIDEDVLERFDAIREAIGDESKYSSKPDRSALVEEIIIEWIAENEHYLDGEDATVDTGGEDGTGNPITALVSD